MLLDKALYNLEIAKPEDIERIKTIFIEAIDFFAAKDYTSAQLQAWKAATQNENIWQKIVSQNKTWLAKYEGYIVGFGTLAEDNQVEMLYVDKSFGRKGVATLLLDQIFNEILRQNQNLATAHVSLTALPFFEKKGFKIVQIKEVNRGNEVLVHYRMSVQLKNSFKDLPNYFETNRLIIKLLKENQFEFINKLVNTPGWLRFIGDRQVHSDSDAQNYIKKLLSSPLVQYYVVNSKAYNCPVGVITVIQKDLLPYPDLGFAFLLEYNNQGFATEAARKLLQLLSKTTSLKQILAVCESENTPSKKVLQKLNFTYLCSKVSDSKILEVHQLAID